MKVLLLTDYSELSAFMRNVTDKIAQLTGWEVHVFNVVNIPSELTKIDHENIDMKCTSEPLVYVEERSYSIQKMELFTSSMKARYVSNVYYGGILDTIEDYVKENNIELIAMGTVYSRGIKNFFNNTLLESIIKVIDVPVLSLKCNRDNAVFSDILLYCDFENVNHYDFSLLNQIKEAFNSRLHLLHISINGENDEAMIESMKGFAKSYNIDPDFIKSIKANSRVDGVIKYVEEFERSGQGSIELIAVQKRLRKEVGKYFLGSKAAKFVNKIERPILTVTSLKQFD